MMVEPFIRLAACRTNAQKTQEEWAKLLGVSKATVISWENGATVPKYTKMMEISRLSGIPIQFIFVPEESYLIRTAEVENGDTQ